MQRWAGRVALVTGASSGIGAAVAEMLVQHGMTVVGCARDASIMQGLVEKSKSAKGAFHPVSCDLKDEKQILALYDVINNQHGGLDVCINNAGLGKISSLMDGRTEDWVEQWQVNVLALSICAREAIKSMKHKGVEDGHIVNINSLSGHSVHPKGGDGHFYEVTKHAVTAATEALRMELSDIASKIRVTQVSPGYVKTQFMARMRTPEIAEKRFAEIPYMVPDDMAEAVKYVLSTPAHVEVRDVLLAHVGEK